MANPFFNYDWPNPVTQKSLPGAVTWGPQPLNVALHSYAYSTKFEGLVVLGTPQNAATATKFEGLAVLGTPQNAATVTKFVGYVIFVERPAFLPADPLPPRPAYVPPTDQPPNLVLYQPAQATPAVSSLTDLPPPARRPPLPEIAPNLVLSQGAAGARPFYYVMDLPPGRLPWRMPEAIPLNPNLFPPPAGAQPFTQVMDLPPRGVTPRVPDIFPNLVLFQGPAPAGQPFTYVMELPPRGYPPIVPDFTPYNLNLINVAVAVELQDTLAITDSYGIGGEVHAAVLDDRLTLSDGYRASAPPAVKKSGVRFQIIDPRFMTIEHWTRMTRETILQVGFVPVWAHGEDWHQWAQSVRQLPALAGLQIPDPRPYGDDWRSWGFRLNEALLNAQ